jgi:hypothetical protein
MILRVFYLKKMRNYLIFVIDIIYNYYIIHMNKYILTMKKFIQFFGIVVILTIMTSCMVPFLLEEYPSGYGHHYNYGSYYDDYNYYDYRSNYYRPSYLNNGDGNRNYDYPRRYNSQGRRR